MMEDRNSKDAISKSDVYERLWRGRDFEIEHLWQRSIFLGTFLVLIFTAYIGLWSVVFGQMKSDDTKISSVNYLRKNDSVLETLVVTSSDSPTNGLLLEEIEIAIGFIVLSCLGSIFSLLWIFMAKGSKYWYEKYETSISSMQEDLELFDDEINQEWYKEKILAKLEHRAEKQIPIHGCLRNHDANSSFVFSLLGGPYSVSKVNVLIGVVFSCFWFFVEVLHWYTMIPLVFLRDRLIISFLAAMLVNLFLLLLLGNLSLSGESGWDAIFKPLQVGSSTRLKSMIRKKIEIKWISEKLSDKEYNNYGYLFNSINRKEKIPSKSNRFKKWLNTEVKKLIDKNQTDQLYGYLEENVIAYEFPKAMQGGWRSGDRSIKFEPEVGDKTKNEWETQILEVIEQLSSFFLKENIITRVFSEIPWNEIVKVDKCRFSTDDYESWETNFFLCDKKDKDKALCYEVFRLEKKQNAENEYSLKSTLKWLECKTEQVFSWTKTK